MASRDSFTIMVRARGCHGSAAAQGVDPVAVSAYLITALQTLVSREINGTDQAVLTIGSIHGGEVYNIIPDEVVLEGAVRCLNEGIRIQLEKRIREMCEGIARTMRASCEIVYERGYPGHDERSGADRFRGAVRTAAAWGGARGPAGKTAYGQ